MQRPGIPKGHYVILVSLLRPKGRCQFPLGRPALREMPKPGDLPFGEVAAPRLHPGDGLRQRACPSRCCKYFLVAQGLGGLPA